MKVSKYAKILLVTAVVAGFVIVVNDIKVNSDSHLAAAIRFKKTVNTEWQKLDPEIQQIKRELKKTEKEIKDENSLVKKVVDVFKSEDKKSEEKTETELRKVRDAKLVDLALKSPKEAIRYIEKEKPEGVVPVRRENIQARIVIVEELNEKTGELDASYVAYAPEENLQIYSDFVPETGGQLEILNLEGYQSGDVIFAGTIEAQEAPVGEPLSVDPSDPEYKVLVLLVDFLDSQNSDDFTIPEAEEWFGGYPLRDFFYEQSYGKMDITADVHGWITMPLNSAGTGCNATQDDYNGNFGGITNPVLIDYLNQNNISFEDYNHLVVYSDCQDITWGGYAETITYNGSAIPAAVVKGINQDGPSLHLAAHEMGHALYGEYTLHANGYECFEEPIEGSGQNFCQHVEYGNFFDAMGSWQAFSHHFRAPLKERRGWIDESQILEISEEGVYTISSLETLDGYKFARIKPSYYSGSNPVYYLEYRSGFGFDNNLLTNPWNDLSSNTQGLIVYSAQEKLLDMTPTELAWEDDIKEATLNIGEVLQDDYWQISIETISVEEEDVTFEVLFNEAGLEPCVIEQFETWGLISTNLIEEINPLPGEQSRYDIDIVPIFDGSQTCGTQRLFDIEVLRGEPLNIDIPSSVLIPNTFVHDNLHVQVGIPFDAEEQHNVFDIKFTDVETGEEFVAITSISAEGETCDYSDGPNGMFITAMEFVAPEEGESSRIKYYFGVRNSGNGTCFETDFSVGIEQPEPGFGVDFLDGEIFVPPAEGDWGSYTGHVEVGIPENFEIGSYEIGLVATNLLSQKSSVRLFDHFAGECYINEPDVVYSSLSLNSSFYPGYQEYTAYLNLNNSDGEFCAPSDFVMNITTPAGVDVSPNTHPGPEHTFVFEAVELVPGHNELFSAAILVPDTAEPDDYPIIFNFRNLGSGEEVNQEYMITVD